MLVLFALDKNMWRVRYMPACSHLHSDSSLAPLSLPSPFLPFPLRSFSLSVCFSSLFLRFLPTAHVLIIRCCLLLGGEHRSLPLRLFSFSFCLWLAAPWPSHLASIPCTCIPLYLAVLLILQCRTYLPVRIPNALHATLLERSCVARRSSLARVPQALHA